MMMVVHDEPGYGIYSCILYRSDVYPCVHIPAASMHRGYDKVIS